MLTLDGGGTSTDVSVVARRRADADHRGLRRRLPEPDPDDRRRHRRRRRRLDRLVVPGGRAQGRAAVRRRRPRPDVLRQGRHRADGHRRARRPRPHPAAPAGRPRSRSTSTLPGPGCSSSAASSGSAWRTAPRGVLEISAWNQANALRQVSVKRGLDVRDFTLVTFGGSGSLLAGRLVDVLGLAGGARAARAGQRVGVRAAHRRRPERPRAHGRPARTTAGPRPRRRRRSPRSSARPRTALAAEGFAGADVAPRAHAPTCATSGRRRRCGSRCRPATLDAEAVVGALPRRARAALRLRLRRPARPARRVGEPARDRRRADPPPGPARARRPGTATRRAHSRGAGDVVFEEALDDVPVYWRAGCSPATSSTGRRSSRSSGRPSRCIPASPRRVDPHLNLLVTGVGAPGASAGGTGRRDRCSSRSSQGTLGSVEREVETAIGRTSRSPMIRDAHDFRVGIHDRTAAQAHRPLVLARSCTPSCGTTRWRRCGRGTSSSTTTSTPVRGRHRAPAGPVRHRAGVRRPCGSGEVVAFVQAFGHHDDIGGAVPGSMPSTATSVFQEGLMVPPIKLWSAGVPNEAALTIMTRNSPDAGRPRRRPRRRVPRLPAWARGGSASSSTRYGADAVEAAFDDDPPTDDRDLPPRDPPQDPRRHVRLGGLRRARRRRAAEAPHPADHADQDGGAAGPRLHGHRAAGEGTDQPRGRLRRRQLPRQVARADPAQPRRHPGADGRARRQRGRGAAASSCASRRRARC